MKKIITIALMIFTFGIAKAHMIKTTHPAFTQKKFVVTGINRLKNYDVTFNVYSPPIKRWIKKDRIETTVNSFGVEVNRTKIAVSSIEKTEMVLPRRIYFAGFTSKNNKISSQK